MPGGRPDLHTRAMFPRQLTTARPEPSTRGPESANRTFHRPIRPAIRTSGRAILPAAVFWVLVGLAIHDSALSALAAVGGAFAVWLLVEHRTSSARTESQIATRVAIGTNLAAIMAVTADPIVGLPMIVGALIPAAMVLGYVERRVVGRLMVVGALSATYVAVATQVLPWGSDFGIGLNLILGTSTLAIAYLIYSVFLWNTSGELADTADELEAVIELSREVALTFDPQHVGRIIARHIATAAGATHCALSTWDRDNDQVVTFAYYPPEHHDSIQPTYDLRAFPATRRVLVDGRPCRVDVDDRASDPSEIEYLRSIGHRSMVMLPLLARGETIGIVELSSDRGNPISERGAALAEQLAREAAISLENARLYQEIHHQAFRDSLTGLANRVLFRDRVSHALDRLRGRSMSEVAVLFLDLDHFKLLNDQFGHSRGDEVLQAVAERVRAAIRPGDTAARLGGDEFAILLEDVTGPSAAIAVANRVLAGLEGEIQLVDAATQVGVTIGIALSGTDGDTVDDLLRNADIAMYQGKAHGRGRIELFRHELLEQASARSQRGAMLRGAVDRGELRLVFQPIVDLANRGRHVVGLEALVRWQPTDGDLLMPADFIALAEETGDIVSIGAWVMREACRQTRAWQEFHRLPELRVNVNLSARQFADPEIVETVADALAWSGLAPDCLTIEITESTLMARTDETLELVRNLRMLGVRISIDDFGTGYSSLSYLQAFEVDELKIDRSFVSDATTIGNPMVLSRAIVELGRALGLEMVVEGVETKAQAAWFASLGCQFAQGYLYARPLDPASVGPFLDSHSPARTDRAAQSGKGSLIPAHPHLEILGRDLDESPVVELG